VPRSPQAERLRNELRRGTRDYSEAFDRIADEIDLDTLETNQEVQEELFRFGLRTLNSQRPFLDEFARRIFERQAIEGTAESFADAERRRLSGEMIQEARDRFQNRADLIEERYPDLVRTVSRRVRGQDNFIEFAEPLPPEVQEYVDSLESYVESDRVRREHAAEDLEEEAIEELEAAEQMRSGAEPEDVGVESEEPPPEPPRYADEEIKKPGFVDRLVSGVKRVFKR